MVSVLIPTTGRPQLAADCVRGIHATTEGHEVEVVAAVDADPETARLLEDLGCVVDYSQTYRGCSPAWNVCLSHAAGDPIVLGADDLQWQPGWLDAALQALSEHPDALIGFNDGHMNGHSHFSTHYLMPRRFIVEVLGGVVAWDCYAHSFNDLEANERARRAGRYHWCEEARVHHAHWLWGSRAKDETDTRNLGGHGASQRVFNERQAAGFPNDYEPVIEC